MITDTYVTLSQKLLHNNNFIYYDQIDQHGESTRGLVCHLNSCGCSNKRGNPQGHWYSPNGEIIPSSIKQTKLTMFTEKRENEILLKRFGHPSQTGRYFCKGPNNTTVYIHIGKLKENARHSINLISLLASVQKF